MSDFLDFIFSPEIFNLLIIGLFLAGGIRWAYMGDWRQTLYFFAAAAINVAVFPK